MYTLYQIYLEKTHMEVGIFALDVVDMKHEFTSFCMNSIYIYDQVLVIICKILWKEDLEVRFEAALCFQVRDTQAFFIQNPRLLVISQQTCFCYSLPVSQLASFAVSMATRIFELQSRILVCGGINILYYRRNFDPWKLIRHPAVPRHVPPLNHLCFAHMFTPKCEFLFDENTVTCSNF